MFCKFLGPCPFNFWTEELNQCLIMLVFSATLYHGFVKDVKLQSQTWALYGSMTESVAR